MYVLGGRSLSNYLSSNLLFNTFVKDVFFTNGMPDKIKPGNFYLIIDAHYDLKYNTCEGKFFILIRCCQNCQ